MSDLKPVKKFKTLQEILDVDDRKHEDLFVDEWDTHVRIGTMDGVARDTWEQKIVALREQKQGTKNLRASLIAMCWIDEAGARVVASEEDIAALGTKNARVLDRLFSAAMRVNKMREKDLKELEGN